VSNAAHRSLRESFDEDGYGIAPALLDADAILRGRLAIERFVTPQTPESVAHIWGTRRQTRTPEAFIPELDEFAYHPRVLDAVSQMLDGPFRLESTPIVVVTFTGVVCGDIQTSNWLGHLDGVPTEPFEKIAHAKCSLWVSFADIETMGGAMVVVPGSHRHVHRRALSDPAWAEYRCRDNLYTRQYNIEGMPWNPVEITCNAGDGFFYHGHSVHSASDNHRQQARIVALYNYATLESSPASAESLAKSFSAKHLESMSPPMRKTVGA
jgi:hypothetical protein